MAKGGRRQKKDTRNPKRQSRNEGFGEENMDDEIDAFHKQREIIPLDVSGDLDASDEDNEQPVFDFEDVDEGDSDEDDDEFEDDAKLTGLAAKISRQQKQLQHKWGGVEDDMHDEEEEEEEGKAIWGRSKNLYYSAENVDYEIQSSDEDLPAEEEAEVLRLQMEKAKSLSMADFGLEDSEQEESDSGRDRKLEDILPKAGKRAKPPADNEAEDEAAYEEIKKDLGALSREEQMEVVYSSAPELVGLLSELNDALDQLEGKVNPLLSKVKENKDTVKGGIRYLEVKQVLLLTYCQAICFYLLLKSEGRSVRDHPVIARLVEIKNLLDKMKQLDDNLPSAIEEILNQDHGDESETKLIKANVALTAEPAGKEHVSLPVLTKNSIAQGQATTDLSKVDSLKDRENKQEKFKHQSDHVGLQSMEMLKLRATLEEKLKQKGILSSLAKKMDGSTKHIGQPMNRQLETLDDFGDEVIDKDVENGHATSVRSIKLANTKARKTKVASGDVDLPMRDDIGERRRKHELRVLAKAGVKATDDVVDEFEARRHTGGKSMDVDAGEDEETEESGDEFYKEVKRQRIAKLSSKAELYARKAAIPPSEEETELVDGKRQINYQMEKNRGLTRNRKKLTKNPRKKYKLKHQKAMVRRKGQVRDIKKPTGSYGGEVSGINAGISRSIRFKN